MAATSPPELLRRSLADRLGSGDPFPSVWPEALSAALGEAESTTERAEWLAALEGTRSSWEAAYAGQPATSSEWALSVVGSDPERVVPLPDRACDWCEGAIPATKKASAIYCGKECQRAANGRPLAA